MTPLATVLQKAAAHLRPHRDALLEAWLRAAAGIDEEAGEDRRADYRRALDALLDRLGGGEPEALLLDDGQEAAASARAGARLTPRMLSLRILESCCLAVLRKAYSDPDTFTECVLALHELGYRRLEVLLNAQEEEVSERLQGAEERAAQAREQSHELQGAAEELRQARAQSQRRADQIGLMSAVVHRIAGVLEPERLLQEAAEAIQSRMDYTFVAVVILDEEGMLMGRWAGRPGVGRRGAGRTQGPAGGVIGRALRLKAPQVVPDVTDDADYHPDVPGTRSEMAIPLLENGEAVGVLDFQSQEADAFGLDHVAAGETMAEFLVVALRNARLYAEARRPRT